MASQEMWFPNIKDWAQLFIKLRMKKVLNLYLKDCQLHYLPKLWQDQFFLGCNVYI